MLILENEPVNTQGLTFGASAYPENIRARLEVFEDLTPIGERENFADIGCGHGRYSLELASHCKRISLVDIQAQNIESARAAFVAVPSTAVDFHCAPAEALPLPSDTYDAVFMIEVLEHVDDVPTCLQEALRILKSGGRFYLSVPNRLFPFELHPIKMFGRLLNPRFFPLLPWFPRLHRRLATARMFTPEKLRRLAEQAGFRVFKFGYVMPPFEMSGLAFLRGLSRACGRTPLRLFGVSVAAVLTK